jgi:hypothetical protein
MAVKELPLVWEIFAEDRVALSEGRAVVSQTEVNAPGWPCWSLTTSGAELTAGKHFWEVKLLSSSISMIFCGVSKPDLEPRGYYNGKLCNQGWFIEASAGTLCGSGKYNSDRAGGFRQGDRMGVLLDLGDGSLRFWKNGVPHGPGYPAGSITGPVVHAVQMLYGFSSVQLVPDPTWPT